MPRVDAMERLGLRAPTRAEWVGVALADPVATLVDHAHCEMKAATTALMMAARYAQFVPIADAMLALARQEITHYESVSEELRRRGRHTEPHGSDAYARALRSHVRGNEPERLLDLLLVSSLVEARSCERFEILADAVEDESLRALWSEFAVCEAGHHALFISLAETIADSSQVATRLRELQIAESEIIATLSCEAKIHG